MFRISGSITGSSQQGRGVRGNVSRNRFEDRVTSYSRPNAPGEEWTLNPLGSI